MTFRELASGSLSGDFACQGAEALLGIDSELVADDIAELKHERGGHEVENLRTVSLAIHETRLVQDTKLLRHVGLFGPKLLDEIGHAQGPLGQKLQDL